MLDAQTGLGPRLRGVLRALIEVYAPYHGFAATVIPGTATTATTTANAAITRDAAIALYAEVIGGARIAAPASLRSRLPELLWLYAMGVLCYWAHDTSPGRAKTYRLIDSTAPLAERLIRLARFPLARSLVRQLLLVINEARG